MSRPSANRLALIAWVWTRPSEAIAVYLSSGIRLASSSQSFPIAACMTFVVAANSGFGNTCCQILVMFSRSLGPISG